ncbi:MAG TPA: hypothetical protein VN702_19895 [Acetobacteraceae bacterium]|nr:hypothetical protein [Acetobacteraceae bacterium]
MYTVPEILRTGRVKFRVFAGWSKGNVYVTKAGQLIGGYKNLGEYRDSDPNYKGWHCHHVVEADDLVRLGVVNHAPPYDEQLNVLLPERAHVGRINSILRKENPTRYQATGEELRQAYKAAYEMMGDYCGGGEANIQQELVAIVDATFQKLGVA